MADEDDDSDDDYMRDPKAKTVAGFMEALTILARYMEKGMEQPFFTAAEHDVLYVHTESDKSTDDWTARPAKGSADGKRLRELGWHFDGESDGWAYFT
jgi:hypothetical protein